MVWLRWPHYPKHNFNISAISFLQKACQRSLKKEIFHLNSCCRSAPPEWSVPTNKESDPWNMSIKTRVSLHEWPLSLVPAPTYSLITPTCKKTCPAGVNCDSFGHWRGCVCPWATHKPLLFLVACLFGSCNGLCHRRLTRGDPDLLQVPVYLLSGHWRCPDLWPLAPRLTHGLMSERVSVCAPEWGSMGI